MPCQRQFNLLRHILTASIVFSLCISARAADQHWLRVSSDHFIVLTDAPEKSGHEVVARFEQMRSVFGQLLMRNKLTMSQPLEIIAVANDKEYENLSPLVNNEPITAPGFWLAGEDRVIVVLNLSEPDSWRAVEHQFAHFLLSFNYPPTPAWFDEGFAEYFASLYLTNKSAELGSDPELNPVYETDLLGNQRETKNPEWFTEILNNPVWLAWPDLLTMKNRVVNGREGTHQSLFYAQSWILVHYLLNQDKMSDLGKYFGLVYLQKLPVDQAVQQAFGMSVTQLDHEVKTYFHSLTPLFTALDASKQPNASNIPQAVTQIPLSFSTDDVGTSSKQIPLGEAEALVDEMKLRIPERSQQAFDDLEKLIDDPKTESVVAHRALAWAYVQRHQTNQAFEELNDAVHINANDPWTRFGLALASYHSGQQGARVQGLANMMESLHIVLAEYPNFAEAYNMLGWARLAGGGPNAAIESLKLAVQFAPRNEQYQFLLARAYLSAKKFNDASAILDRLKLSSDPQLAQAASKELIDLPFLQKYGVPPEEAKAQQEQAKKEESNASDEEDDDQKPGTKPDTTSPSVDKRPVKFLKGILVSVDCSKSPVAVLSFSDGKRTLKIRSADYKSVAVIGAPEFSCDWKGKPVDINYRASGPLAGDLVSIEVQ
ncbi:MAG TPA: hypothetical protein VFA85_03165 [Terriglobales bacterium]|nr:hypothetical protein [Terriglobales bacterium]